MFRKGLNFVVLWGIVSCAFFQLALARGVFRNSAEAREENISGPDAAVMEKCMKDFDIDAVDLTTPSISAFLPLLKGYFLCQAAARNDITECDNIGTRKEIKECRKDFEDYYGVYGKLAREQRLSLEIIDACVNSTGQSEQNCKAFLQAWLKSDSKYCLALSDDGRVCRECAALVQGEVDSCGNNDGCRAKASYIKAIRSGDVSYCAGIPSPQIRMFCQANIMRDAKICLKEAGLGIFRNKYCEAMARQGGRIF